ncbi:MAG: hypothetical protein WB615_14850 [Candidatus Tumulicola sp.]
MTYAGSVAAARTMPDTTKIIYVTSPTYPPKILGFKLGSTGNAKPVVTITSTGLDDPQFLAIAPSGKIYVANGSYGPVQVYPAGGHGSEPGEELGGSTIHRAGGVAVDAFGQIYVSDALTDEIYVWKKDAIGNVSPIRTISGSNTLLHGPYGMACDSHGNLWVATDGADYWSRSSSILEFAKGANGDVAPITAIGGSRTGLSEPPNVHVDPTDRIITTGGLISPNSVRIFAAGSNGNVRPAVIISGSRTKLIGVTTVGGDYQGRIYATTVPPHSGYGSILVFGSQAHGNASPVADITGPKTGVQEPFSPTLLH